MINRHLASALALTGIAVVAACGGGGGGSHTPVAAVPQPSATTGIAGPANGTRGTVSIAIPASSKAAAAQRRTQFVSPSAQSVTLTINGSTANYDVSSTSSNCTPATGVRICSLPVSVPATTTTATVTLSLFDGTAGLGTQLGSGSGSATVSGTNPFTVIVDVSPIIAFATFSLSFPSTGLPRISLAHAEIGTAIVTYMDPDRNAIPSNGTSTFVNPVTLSVVDPSNTVSISPTTPITNAAQVVTVTYTGGNTIGPSVTFNATAGGPSIGTLVSRTSGFQTTYALGLAAGFSKMPNEIDVGPDNFLWFSEAHNVSIARMNPADGTYAEFTVASPGSSPQPAALAAGPVGDPHMWYTQPSINGGNPGNFGNVVVPSGATTTFTGVVNSGPYGIRAVGGNMWIALQNANKMLVASTTGLLVSPAPALPAAGTGPGGIAAGPDGNVWVTGFLNGTILSYNPTAPFNLLSQTLVPAGSGAQPAEIVTGPDNALWFTEQIAGKIGRLLPGSPPIVEFTLPGPYGTPWAIVSGGAEGGVWFTASEPGHSDIVRIDPTTHAFVAYQIASSTTQSSYGLAMGPDGNLWMTDFNASSIVKIQP